MTKVPCELDPGGSPPLDNSINPSSAESPPAETRIHASKDKNGEQEAKGRHICLLVVGPSGSGKSSFITSVTRTSKAESEVVIGHGMDPCTVSCSSHEITDPTSGTRITLLDTPGFNDQSRNDLDILGEIATFVSSSTLPPISAVIFTHAITATRVTGSTRLNLEITKALCGEAFYPRLALLTTMWNQIPNDMEDMREACNTREYQILASPALRGEMKSRRCINGHFDGTSASGWKFIQQIMAIDQANGACLCFKQELRAGAKVEETKAGAIISAEREKRRQQIEAELLEIQNDERVKLQLRMQELRQNEQELGMRLSPFDQAPGMQHPMAYGRPPTTFDQMQHRRHGSQQGRSEEVPDPVSLVFEKVCAFGSRLIGRSVAWVVEHVIPSSFHPGRGQHTAEGPGL